MADKREYYEHIHAYALGCLDKAEFISLRNEMHSLKDYPWQELGEYQNLSALLPSILNVEVPEPQLKDKVARKLYRIRDEIRTKRTGELNTLRQPGSAPHVTPEQPKAEEKNDLAFTPPFEEEKTEEEEVFNDREQFPPEEEPPYEEPEEHFFIPPAEESHEDENIISHTSEFEVVTPTRRTSDFFRPPQDTQIRERDSRGNFEPPRPPKPEPEPEIEDHEDFYKDSPVEIPEVHSRVEHKPDTQEHIPSMIERKYLDKTYAEKEEPAQKSNMLFIVLIGILFLILIVAGVYAYLSISSDVKSYKTEMLKLNEELKGRADSDVKKELQKMIESPDTRIVNLSAIMGNGFGRVIFNSQESKGYLQLGNMPYLPEGRSYQLWINANGLSFTSLGTYNGSNSVEYYPIDLPELSNTNKIRILLTEEPAAGSLKPGRRVYLDGAL